MSIRFLTYKLAHAKTNRLCMLVCLFTCLLSTEIRSSSIAQDSDIKQSEDVESTPADRVVEEVFVSAIYQLPLSDLVKSVDIIDRKAIERSAAKSIPELLSNSANVSLSSFSGNAKRTRIDIRGAGDTSVSNVLVVVDNQPVSNNDLGGVDFSQIPLENIDRIEIIKGANSVRYGSGASQGVIKIYTRLPKRTSLQTTIERGDFETKNQNANLSYRTRDHALGFNLSSNDSEGYRDHNALYTQTSSVNYRLQKPDRFLNLNYKRYQDDYQLPGPLSLEQLNSGEVSPTAANTEGNLLEGSVDLSTTSLAARQQFKQLSIFAAAKYQERKDSIREIPPNNIVLEGFIQSQSKLALINAEYRLAQLKITAGAEVEDVHYKRLNPSILSTPLAIEAARVIQVENQSRAYFIHSEYTPLRALNLSFGYRKDKSTNDDFRTQIDSSTPIFGVNEETWKNEAYEFGTLYTRQAWSIYSSIAKTFRNPNADEIQLTESSDISLIPQSAERYELGARRSGRNHAFNLSLYKARIENEIIFREGVSGFGANINLAQTSIRQGLEASINLKPAEWLLASINFGELSAKLADGNKIPLVSERTASASITMIPSPATSLSWNVRYFSERFDGNDFNNNTFSDLPSVTTHNAKLTFNFLHASNTKMRCYLSANNIFDKQYVTAAYSGSAYPHPGFNLTAGLQITI